MLHRALDLERCLGMTQAFESGHMLFGTWNVRRSCRSASLKSFARKLAKYNLDLVEIQEVEWDSGGTVVNELKSFGCTLIEPYH
jgi:hypothetical protein